MHSSGIASKPHRGAPAPPARWRRISLRPWLLLPLCLAGAHAADPPERRNWFEDPFFAMSAALPGCPVPAGPFITERERREQSHGRADRGTTCWLGGACERPNSYAYDAGIAAALRAALARQHPAPRSSLWATVQRRIVFIEGCVESEQATPALESFAAAIPDVERVVVIVTADWRGGTPYKQLVAP